jgi:hypothetical protein
MTQAFKVRGHLRLAAFADMKELAGGPGGRPKTGFYGPPWLQRNGRHRSLVNGCC